MALFTELKGIAAGLQLDSGKGVYQSLAVPGHAHVLNNPHCLSGEVLQSCSGKQGPLSLGWKGFKQAF